MCLPNVLQAQVLVEEGKITKSRRHEQPPLGQAGRDVDEALQPALTQDLRLLTRLSRCNCCYCNLYILPGIKVLIIRKETVVAVAVVIVEGGGVAVVVSVVVAVLIVLVAII